MAPGCGYGKLKQISDNDIHDVDLERHSSDTSEETVLATKKKSRNFDRGWNFWVWKLSTFLSVGLCLALFGKDIYEHRPTYSYEKGFKHDLGVYSILATTISASCNWL
jgi:hypothetical protein